MKSLAQQFADWVATKPADEEYNYLDANNCAVTQFAREMGYPHLEGANVFEAEVFPPALYLAVHSLRIEGEGHEWTFGALASRLAHPIKTEQPV